MAFGVAGSNTSGTKVQKMEDGNIQYITHWPSARNRKGEDVI